MDYFFSTQALTVGYNGRPVVRDITVRLAKGRILTLIGPNGGGKSTILKTILRQLDALGGVVLLGDKSTDTLSQKTLAQSLSIVLTQRMKTERMTSRDVVETGRYPYTGPLGILSPRDHQAVDEAMTLTHTTTLANRDFMQLSDGQRQRVLLARAIAQEPEVLVLDEPTSYLDVRYKLELLSLLRTLTRQKNLAVILSLHELDLAQRISDDVLCVKGETVFQYGPAEALFQADLISRLYDLPAGRYDPLFGSVELVRVEGTPRAFVIAGGGTGTPLFRYLQKEGIPFATGVLPENDLDFPTASALAVQVIAERAFQPVGDAAINQAAAVLTQCERVFCPLRDFGPVNEKNQALLRLAEEHALLTPLPWESPLANTPPPML